MSTHSGQTGQVTKVKLDAAIEQVYWTRRQAAPGATVGLEVFTRYVGNDAGLKIELTDHEGKNHGTFSDKIHGNHFWAPVKVPANAKGALYASVKLSKHGLSQKSAPLVLLPPVQISNVKWDKSDVRRGDILKLSANINDVPDGVEASVEIFEHDSDGAHELVTKFTTLVKGKKIEAEWEFEYHEDTGHIPSHHETEKGYHPPEFFFRVNVGETTADSGTLKFQDWLHMELKDESGNPYPNEEYVLTFADGTTKKGKLDEHGKAMVEKVPPGVIVVEYPRQGIKS
jgi:hypothetical protein